MVQCSGPVLGRRRIFWTTQPDACGSETSCQASCGSSGLETYVPEGADGRTFRNNDWVRGLALNILLTDAQKDDTACGHRPGARGGHWSDSYRTDGQKAGTQLRYIPRQKSVQDSVQLIQAYMAASLNKLVAYGVAAMVTVTVKYIGRNTYNADIEIIGQNGQTSRVGIVGNRLENSWVWEAK